VRPHMWSSTFQLRKKKPKGPELATFHSIPPKHEQSEKKAFQDDIQRRKPFHVKVIRGVNLPPQKGLKLDPFVVATLGKKKKKSKHVKKTLNPEWNKTFRFAKWDELPKGPPLVPKERSWSSSCESASAVAHSSSSSQRGASSTSGWCAVWKTQCCWKSIEKLTNKRSSM